MTSREKILERVRQNKPEQKLLPERFRPKSNPQTKDQLLIQFKESLKKVGALMNEIKGGEEVQAFIKKHYSKSVDLRGVEAVKEYSGKISNKEMGKTEVVILEGQFGVSENGAIWFDETDFPNRLIPFVTEQLVVVLNTNNIVIDMHEAYRKIDMKDTGFGVFIAGPSKTADIEQSLVYGAHGAKKLSVLLVFDEMK